MADSGNPEVRAPGGARRRGIHVGTSGWTYDDWTGVFYPEEVGGAERLAFYATRFDTVEVNASFYRFPTEPMVRAWNRRLPRGFHLAVKGHRQITHLRKLASCEEPLAAFLRRVWPLRTLRVILWQLPPSLRKDVPRLEDFLTLLDSLGGSRPEDLEASPATGARRRVERAPHRGLVGKGRPPLRHAVEFRHEGWWDDEVAACLSRHGACFVAVSHPRLPDRILPTGDFLYLRFHGLGRRLYDYDYRDEELRGWADRVREHLRGRVLYAFFNNDWHANAPRNAAAFRRMILERGDGGTSPDR